MVQKNTFLLKAATIVFTFIYGISGYVLSQENAAGNISGSFQSDVQYLFPDSIIGAAAVDEHVLSNSFLQLTYQRNQFSAGVRYEAYLNPLLGFDQRYKGQGIPYRFASYNSDKLDITVGNFYDQFGNGTIFRAYQEWALGIDNSIDGIRARFSPIPGFYVKGFIGKQRKFWERANSLVRGADTELNLNQAIAALSESKLGITLGASVVNKYQQDDDIVLQLPENVSAFSGRARINYGNFAMDAEYAYKINDPFQLNRYVYNPGNALYFNATYSQKGLGINVSAKRIDNMDFRSERTVTLQELSLSFLPAISKLHTYRLPTLYPYATQLNGEVGFQASILYTIPKGTALGGKYGTQLSVNYSRISGLDTIFTEPKFRYTSSFLGDLNKLYFEDINVEINKKFTKNLRMIFTYIHLKYNQDVIAFGTTNGGHGIVDTHVGVVEAQYRIARKVSIRGELQHMYTKQDMGSWVMALAELSISPHWYITVFDEYNYSNPDPDLQVHYYNFSAAYAFEAHRISLGYSRQRRGLLCVGGICREVPASNGFGLSISSSF
ncbi:MAG: DUF6029 family protein [Bacteroidia bacterium]